jgi:pectin methylesterase-like acyl-CoA thioesterase
LLLAATPAAAAVKIVVHNGESIQAAIDAAPPGATIIVKPGVYQGTSAARALTITKEGSTSSVPHGTINPSSFSSRASRHTVSGCRRRTRLTWPIPSWSPCGMVNERCAASV